MPDFLVAAVASFVIAAASLYTFIPVLRKIKFGQYVRREGPSSHLSKAGTPTMGGCVFFLSITGAMFIAGGGGPGDYLAAFLIISMGVIGFLDDLLKIRRKDSGGLSKSQKMAGQILAALVFSTVLWRLQGGWIWLPSSARLYDMGVLFVPAAAFVTIATVNGVNFTDGIDGLCSGVTFIVAVAYLLLCRAWGLTGVAWLAGALAGSCLGFLCFNVHPAKVFMGDTGSLALGGAVAALALYTRTAVLLPLLGIVYVVEVGSVMLQVRYFKMTGGKRIFRMSPLHHHFELGGWNEVSIDIMFWAFTCVAAAVFLWVLITMGY